VRAAPPAPLKKVPRTSAGVKMKAIHWKPVQDRNIGGTVWAELKDDTVLFDVGEFESSFSVATKKPVLKEASAAAPAKAAVPKKEVVTLFDAKKIQNTNIALARFRMAHSAIRDAILMMDETIIDEERLSALLKVAPVQEDFDTVAAYDGDPELLGVTEKFVQTMASIPRLETRLKLMSFKTKFEAQRTEIKTQIDACVTSIKAIGDSTGLRKVMEIALMLGNFLNQGTPGKGVVQGFQLETLNKFKNTKAADNKSTLLHFLVKSVQSKAPQARAFVEELKLVDDASKVELQQVAGELARMTTALKQIDNECKKTDINANGDRFGAVMREFHDASLPLVQAMNEEVKSLEDEALKVIKFFGEDPESMKMADLLRLFAEFARDWTQAENFLEQQRIAAEKEAKKKAEQERLQKAKEAKKAGGAEEETKSPAVPPRPTGLSLPGAAAGGGGGEGAIVDQVLGGLTGSNSAKDIMKMIQARRAAGLGPGAGGDARRGSRQGSIMLPKGSDYLKSPLFAKIQSQQRTPKNSTIHTVPE